MSLVLLGSNGMLGSMIYFLVSTRYPDKKIIPISRKEYDVLRDDISLLDRLIPEDCVVINCIGAIPQKKYTDEEYFKINTYFPHDLSAYCQKRSLKLIHVSTNCVFSGKIDACHEYMIPDTDEMYGKTKYLGEPSYGLVIRCSIIGPERSFCFGLMEWFLQNVSSEIDGYIDSLWNGITTLELSKILIEIVENDDVKNDIVHYYSKDTVSKYDMLLHLKNVFNKNITINKTENGLKYYTLSSMTNEPRPSIFSQINELHDIYPSFKKFYNEMDRLEDK